MILGLVPACDRGIEPGPQDRSAGFDVFGDSDDAGGPLGDSGSLGDDGPATDDGGEPDFGALEALLDEVEAGIDDPMPGDLEGSEATYEDLADVGEDGPSCCEGGSDSGGSDDGGSDGDGSDTGTLWIDAKLDAQIDAQAPLEEEPLGCADEAKELGKKIDAAKTVNTGLLDVIATADKEAAVVETKADTMKTANTLLEGIIDINVKDANKKKEFKDALAVSVGLAKKAKDEAKAAQTKFASAKKGIDETNKLLDAAKAELAKPCPDLAVVRKAMKDAAAKAIPAIKDGQAGLESGESAKGNLKGSADKTRALADDVKKYLGK